MIAQILMEAIFEFLVGCSMKIAAAIFSTLVGAGTAIGRVTHCSRRSTATEYRPVDYIDALLFPDRDLRAL